MPEEIGRYRLTELLGKGGMGEVRLAEDPVTGRKVAIKLIRRERLGDPLARQRFRREARVLVELRHPFIVQVYDIVEDDDRECLVMEYLEGPNLQKMLEAGPVPLERVLQLAREIGEGLAAAHERGIVHRDLKAANVIVDQDHAKLLDFGLAKPLHLGSEDRELSRDRVPRGTLHAMSPEQLTGKDLDERSDLFSLGVLLYELTTGKRPFSGPGIRDQICGEQHVPVRRLNPKVPESLSQLIDQLLEKSPLDRPESAVEVVSRLKKIELSDDSGGQTDIETPWEEIPPASRWRRWRLEGRWLFGGATVAIVIGIVWLLISIFGGAQPRQAVVVLDFVNSTGRADIAWCGTAASNIMTADLGSGGSLRVVGGDEIAMTYRQLGVDQGADTDKVVRSLAVDYVLAGSYTPGTGSDDLFLELKLTDARTGRIRWSAAREIQLRHLSASLLALGRSLRGKLEIGSLSVDDEIALQGSLPYLDVIGSEKYAQGVMRLRILDGAGARESLESALDSDPDSAWILSALSSAYQLLGKDQEALAAARKAWQLADDLPEKERKLVEIRFAEMERNWARVTQIYEELFQAEPDSIELGISLAVAQLSGHRPNGALATLGALDALEASEDDPRVALLRAKAHFGAGEYREQLAAARGAGELCRRLGFDGLVAEALLLEAVALQLLGDANAARGLWQEAHQLARSTQSGLAEIRSLETMALTLGPTDPISAARLFEYALQQYRHLGHRIGEYRALLNLGSLKSRQGLGREAEGLLDQALSGFTEIGDQETAAVAELELGNLALYRGELAVAKERYRAAEEALRGSPEGQNVFYWAVCLTNLGEIHYLEGELEPSRELHEKAYAAKLQSGALAFAAYDSFRLGLVLAAEGHYGAARKRFERARDESLGAGGSASEAELGLALLAWLEGRYQLSETSALKAEESFRDEGNPGSAARARAILALARHRSEGPREAAPILADAERLAVGIEDLGLDFFLGTARALIDTAASPTPVADLPERLAGLRQIAARATSAGFRLASFEARLAEAELTLEYLGKTAPLRSLREEADSLELGSIVQRTDLLLRSAAGDGEPVRAVP